MEHIDKIYSSLDQPKNIVITMHQKPDGDALGSTLALYHFLIQFGHNVQVISPTNWPKFLEWLPGMDKVWDYEKRVDTSKSIISKADWIFCLDFNVLSRTKNMELVIAESKAIKILIDHHEAPDETAFTYGISIPAKSSTAEMVFDFISASGNVLKLNEQISTCIYTGLLTDTGSFRFSATTSSVHNIVSTLMENGLSHTKVHENLFDNGTENRLKFIGNALLNRLEVFYEYNTALIAIPASDITKFDISTGDTEGLVNYPLGIEGIKMAAIIIDRGELRKMSFRSKGSFDVNQFARENFNGGGHKNAAGGQSADDFESTVKQFVEAMKGNRDKLSTYNF